MNSSGSPGRKSPTKGRATRSRRQARNAPRQPTPAELKAMEARRRATIVISDDVVAVEDPRPAPVRRTPSRTAERQRTSTARPTLSRSQEFAFIRSDLRRLIVTAGPLLLLMIVLLVVIDR